jgi:NADPH-dependent glutamate synthase beta subunit-like oxidoreductase/2,4-dienoyl-CoA reductase-like NADH-dependent reductase (Old Yellow Enzyme family)
METLLRIRPKKQNIWDFDLSGIEQLHRLADALSVKIETSEDISILARPVKVGSLTAPNSLATQAMEGCDGNSEGWPGPLTFRRYKRFAAGGAGIIWSEAIAVVPEGRANPRQLWFNENSKETFAELVKQARQAANQRWGKKHNPIIVAQLTHSGRYSKPKGVSEPIIPQHDPYRDVMVPQYPPNAQARKNLPVDWPVVTDEYLDQLQEHFVKAAQMAFEAGFDAVDIKACHGYLINEILACFNRPGKYGGSFENRTRILLEIIDKIHAKLGKDKLVTTRFPMYDAIPYPYGWAVDKDDYTKPDFTEPKKLLKLLQNRGVKFINTTVGNPYYSPHMGRPFNEPILGAYESPEHPLIALVRILDITAEIQKTVPDMVVVGTGYSWLRSLLPYVGAASKKNGKVTVVGAGRMSFAYPDFPYDIIKKGRMDPDKCCIGCSGCTQIMRDGGMAGCVIRDNKVYGPIYERGRMGDRTNLVRLADACRECGDATCKKACPAGIDIPKFIKLFFDGDDRGAYEVIRQANILPEICAWLCPTEELCEGSCMQNFLGDMAMSISDIQRYLAVQANRNGWSRLRIPTKLTGKKVAVIGAGPAGLACAAKLVESGHKVTVFEASNELGGMVKGVIAREKQGMSLENELKAVFESVPEKNLEFRFGKALTADYNLDKVMASGFDAAFIGMGLWESKTLHKGGKLDGLWGALEFLAAVKAGQKIDFTGKRVAVIGGGNTGMDICVAAKQAGADSVYMICFESFMTMPAWLNERQRTLVEDISFMNQFMPKEYLADNGKVRAVKINHVNLAPPDEKGFRKPIEIPQAVLTIDVDVIIESLGQKAPNNLKVLLPGVEITADGLVAVKNGSLATGRKGIFAGGDIINGGKMVVTAVADGTKAAQQIKQFLES